jgi:hypothetical protein
MSSMGRFIGAVRSLRHPGGIAQPQLDRHSERWNITGKLFHGVSSVPSAPVETTRRMEHGDRWNSGTFSENRSTLFHISAFTARPCLPGVSPPFPAGARRAILGGWASVSDA